MSGPPGTSSHELHYIPYLHVLSGRLVPQSYLYPVLKLAKPPSSLLLRQLDLLLATRVLVPPLDGPIEDPQVLDGQSAEGPTQMVKLLEC